MYISLEALDARDRGQSLRIYGTLDDEVKRARQGLRGVVFEGLKVYQGFVLSSNGGHQSIRGAILRLKKLSHY